MTAQDRQMYESLNKTLGDHGAILGQLSERTVVIEAAVKGTNGHGGILAEVTDHEQRLSLVEAAQPRCVTEDACDARHEQQVTRGRDTGWKIVGALLGGSTLLRLLLELAGVLK